MSCVDQTNQLFNFSTASAYSCFREKLADESHPDAPGMTVRVVRSAERVPIIARSVPKHQCRRFMAGSERMTAEQAAEGS